jgi:hypothetical protein
MKEREAVDFFQDLKVLMTDYLTAKLKLFKLEVYEKTAKITATLFSSLVIAMLASLMLFFLSIALGFYFGSVLDSYGTGFMVVTGLYLLLLVPFILFRKSLIEKFIVNRLIEQLNEKEEDDL